jgi:hypothetical protein
VERVSYVYFGHGHINHVFGALYMKPLMQIKRQRTGLPVAVRRPAPLRRVTVPSLSVLGADSDSVETATLPLLQAMTALPGADALDRPTHICWRPNNGTLTGWSPDNDEHEIDVHKVLLRCMRSDRVSPVRARLLGLHGELVADLILTVDETAQSETPSTPPSSPPSSQL